MSLEQAGLGRIQDCGTGGARCGPLLWQQGGVPALGVDVSLPRTRKQGTGDRYYSRGGDSHGAVEINLYNSQNGGVGSGLLLVHC
jgi:hypothetical protein